MPVLILHTNLPHSDISSGFVAKASALVAKTVGKPESYVAVFVKPDSPASFGGSQEPCAFIELQSIGGFGSKTNQIADSLTTFIHNELKIDTDRTKLLTYDTQIVRKVRTHSKVLPAEIFDSYYMYLTLFLIYNLYTIIEP